MRRSMAIRGSVTPSLAIMGHTTMLQRQRSPTGGLANFYINNCGDLRSLQPLRATGAPLPSDSIFSFRACTTGYLLCRGLDYVASGCASRKPYPGVTRGWAYGNETADDRF